MTPTVILFDLDGTLVRTGGAGRRAMRRAFEEHGGHLEAIRSIAFAGMTDRSILRTALRNARLDEADEAIEAIIETYLGYLPDEVRQATGYRVLPGVAALLDELRRVEEVALGLGTGNVEPGARVKLGRARLNPYFAFGGFGSDHEDRTELLRAGLRRGADRLGLSPSDCRTVVVGDTPRDVVAAHAMDAICVAVATGPHESDVLRESGADVVFEDLGDPAALDSILRFCP